MNLSQAATSKHLLEALKANLLCDTPDHDQLQSYLSQELGLSAEVGREFAYHTVKKLNATFCPPISKLELIHTEGCNLACKYCFEENMLGRKKMPFETARAAIDLLCDYSFDEPHLSITHFGGEPTLNFEGVKVATEHAEKKAQATGKSLRFDMTSNGVLLNEEMVNYFAEHEIWVLLSIDGLESTHDAFRIDRAGRGTFKRVMKGLRILKRYQPWIGTKMTIMPQKAHNLYDDVLGLFDLGVNQFLIGHATGIRWSEEEMAIYEEQLVRLSRWYKNHHRQDLRIDAFEQDEEECFFGCHAGLTSIAVSTMGEVSACSKIMGINSSELIGKLGDVHIGLTHIKNRLEFAGCSRLKMACESQGIASDFKGGCFAVNYLENGDMFEPSLQEHAFSKLKSSVGSNFSAGAYGDVHRIYR